MSKPVIILITVVAWAVGCAYTAYDYAASRTAPYYADEYVFEFGYQLLTFAVYRFPFWLVGLIAVVSVEALKLKPTHPKLR
jgi:hypothetical protein